MISTQDLKKIVKSTFSNLSYLIISIISYILLTPIMLKSLGNYYYGLWILATTIISYYGYADLGITSAVTRNMALSIGEKDNEKFNRIFANGLLLNCLISIMLTLITLIIFFILEKVDFTNNNLHTISKIFLILGLSFAFSFPFKTFYSIIVANIKFDVISFIQTIQMLIKTAFMIWLLKNGYGIISLTFVLLFSSLIANFLFVFFGYKLANFIRFHINFIDKTNLLELLKYGSKTIVAQFADLLRTRLDEVVIGIFISIQSVAVYSIANKIVSTANSFNQSFITTVRPLFAKYLGINNSNENKQLFFFLSKITFCTSFCILFCLLFVGKEFIVLWVGEKYIPAYNILIILACGYFYLYIQQIGIHLTYARNKHQYWAVITIIEGILNLVLSLFFALVLKMGIYGIALGTLTSIFIVKTVLQPLLISKMLDSTLKEYSMFFIKNLMIGFGFFICSGVILKKLNINNFSISGMILTTGYFILVSILLFITLLSKQEKSFLLNKFKILLAIQQVGQAMPDE